MTFAGDKPHGEVTTSEYSNKISLEGEYWDHYIAQRLRLGELPGSVDFRLFFTQLRARYNWSPPCLGGIEVNFRRQEVNYILTTAVKRRGARVLDIGCGAGWLSLELARRGAHVTGMDISSVNLALGRYMVETNERNFPFLYRNFAGLGCELQDFGSVEYVYGDLNKIELPPAEYDAVVVWDSLHHVENLEHLLDQIRATLKPGGIFVGVDHSFATERTELFNSSLTPWLGDLHDWITNVRAEWLYEGINTLVSKHDWGVLAVDNDAEPVSGCESFMEQIRSELLSIIQSHYGADNSRPPNDATESSAAGLNRLVGGVSSDEASIFKEASEGTVLAHHISPFEDVSADRLMRVLLQGFDVQRFETICPFITPENYIPGYDAQVIKHRSETELIFLHYVAAALIKVGERAIARGQADGQWFVFHLTPAQQPHKEGEFPEGLLHIGRSMSGTDRISQLHADLAGMQAEVAKLSAELVQRSAYIEHLESEINRKNLALDEFVARIQEQQEELAAARRSRVPWLRPQSKRER